MLFEQLPINQRRSYWPFNCFTQTEFPMPTIPSQKELSVPLTTSDTEVEPRTHAVRSSKDGDLEKQPESNPVDNTPTLPPYTVFTK